MTPDPNSLHDEFGKGSPQRMGTTMGSDAGARAVGAAVVVVVLLAAVILGWPALPAWLTSSKDGPAWVQAVGSVGAILVAVAVPVLMEARRQRREIRGMFDMVALDVEMARRQVEVYMRDGVLIPAYRLSLHGHRQALPFLVAHGPLTAVERVQLEQWYVDAASFNRCLDFAQNLRDGTLPDRNDRLERELRRVEVKAQQLLPGDLPHQRYDPVIALLRRHMPWAHHLGQLVPPALVVSFQG